MVASFHSGYGDRTGVLAQAEVLGAVDEVMDARDVVVCAAGSLPGDLHGMWRTRDRKGYHVEYGFSCMGYEIPGGIGIRLAAPDRDVFVTVGDGSYLMMPTELVTAVQEGIKIIVVLLQNHGYASIGSLAESLGVQRFGTKYRYRNTESGRLDGGILPVDLAANAASLGVKVLKAIDPGRAEGRAGQGQGVRDRRCWCTSTPTWSTSRPAATAGGTSRWPRSPSSTSPRQARETYDGFKAAQRPLL